MGTNYYLVKPEKRCEACGHVFGHDHSTYVHIGKSSVGWHFGFDSREHKTVEAWRDFINKWVSEGGWVCDEYHRNADSEDTWRVPLEQFWQMVEAKRSSPECQAKYSTNWHKTICQNGVDFSDHDFS